MADVFISYASEDGPRIRPLADALHARGFSVWWDRSLAAGDDFATVIARELAAAKVVIVVWTAASAASTFVRDEAERARRDGRLAPILLDRVDIPLGFGAIQAEDFTAWNGRPDAAQMQILDEAIRAKLEGRPTNAGVVAQRRRRLMARVRIVSVLSVIAAVIGVAAGVNNLLNGARPQQSQTDVRAQLLSLLDQGKLTPEQAIELARLLESGAMGATPAAADDGRSDRASPGAMADAASGAASVPAPAPPAIVQTASSETTVSEAEFSASAQSAYRAAMAELLTHPDAEVRSAAADLASPTTRDAALRTLWTVAERGGPSASAIYRVCAAVGATNRNPVGGRALETLRLANPQDASVWRMLSYTYAQSSRGQDAEAAALVGAGLQAQRAGRPEAAERALSASLERLRTPAARAFVEASLGDAAAAQNNWDLASARYAAAVANREQDLTRRTTPAARLAAASIEIDAQKLVRALDRNGQTREACESAERLQTAHDVAPADSDLAGRCAQFRILVRPRIVGQTPAAAPAPATEAAPTPQTDQTAPAAPRPRVLERNSVILRPEPAIRPAEAPAPAAR